MPHLFENWPFENKNFLKKSLKKNDKIQTTINLND